MNKTELVITMFFGVLAIVGVLMIGLWTDSNLEWLISTVFNKDIDIPYVLSLLITALGNGVIIFLNTVITIARYIVAGG